MTDLYERKAIEGKGYGLVAVRDIKAGEVVLREAPVVHAVTRSGFCEGCLKEGDVSRCAGCRGVMYCGAGCQKKGWKEWHKKECGVVKELAEEGVKPTPTLVLTFRLVMIALGKDGGDLAVGLRSHEFLSTLTSHLDSMPLARRDMYAQLSILLNAMLTKCGLPSQPLRILMTAFAICEANSFSITNANLETTAYALYHDGCYVNHSCVPNMVASFSGKDICFMASRNIARGEELTISYVELASTKLERSAELRDRYNFTCTCERCSGPEEIVSRFPPHVLVSGNAKVSSMIAEGNFAQALETANSLTPYLALYGTEYHPSVACHFLNVAKLKWYLEDTDGAYEAGIKAVEIFRTVHTPSSELLKTAAQITADAHSLRMHGG